MRPGSRWACAALVLVLGAGCASSPGPRQVTMEGEFIDPACYFTHGGQGPAHRECALTCARSGQDLAFLNRAGGRIYPILAARHGTNPNDSLYAVVGYPVIVRGTLYETRGQRALAVSAAERLDAGAPDRSR